MKADVDSERVCAFTKRILQQSLSGPSPHAAASLFLLSHIGANQPKVLSMLQQFSSIVEDMKKNEKKDGEENDEDDEKKEEEDDEDEASDKESDDEDEEKEEKEDDEEKEGEEKEYDAQARDPRGAHASNALLWELDLYSNHFHPSVKAFAESLLSSEVSTYFRHFPSYTLSCDCVYYPPTFLPPRPPPLSSSIILILSLLFTLISFRTVS